MEKQTPTVSIIMPCFNRIDMLDKSITSIINQTFSNFEFIIIDDKSDDETVKLLKNYQIKDKRIKIFYNKKNKGPTYSFNKGLYYAKGEFVARMDSDDISHPTRIEKQVKFLKSNPEVFVVGTAVNIIDEDEKFKNKLYLKQNKKELSDALRYSNPLVNSTYMANLNVNSKKYLYLNKVFYPADDYYSWYTIIKKNYKLTNMNEILLSYRLHKSESYLNSRVQGLKTLLVQKLFILKQMNYLLKINNNSVNSIHKIKNFFDKLPSFAKPSRIELLYYEFNNPIEIFRENKWFLKIILSFINIRNLNDFVLFYKFFFRCLIKLI